MCVSRESECVGRESGFCVEPLKGIMIRGKEHFEIDSRITNTSYGIVLLPFRQYGVGEQLHM